MLTRWDPFTEMSKLQNELFGTSNGRRQAFRPAVDVIERGDEILVVAELPGVRSEDVHVDVDDGVLTLRGERKLERESADKNYHILERAYGGFSRSFTLPSAVDVEKIDAELKEGILTVHLPKRESSKPRRIEVKA